MKPTRRAVLQGILTAGAAAGLGVGCAPGERRSDWPTERWPGPGTLDRAIFPLGAQAGEPRPDALIACTKTLDLGPIALHYALFVDGVWQDQASVPATREGDFARVELVGLPADTSVALCFVTEGGARSLVVHARTPMPQGERGPLRFILNACDHRSGAPLPALSNALAFDQLDFHLHLGDAAYCDGSVTIDEYRQVWAEYLEIDGYHDLFSSAAGIYTWDDHEVDNNFDPVTMDPAQIATALQAMHEHLPLPRSVDHPDRLWRSLRFGDTAELFVLDCRGERDRAAGRYMSEEQLQWLLDGLRDSDATWKLIGNSVPMSRLPGPFQTPIATNDTWLGFGDGAQRQRLLDHIAALDLSGVLVLSGDYHMPALSRVEPDGPASRIWEVIGGPGGSFPNPLGLLLQLDEQVVYADAVHNIMIIDLDPGGTARIRLVDHNQIQRLDATIDVNGELLELTTRRSTDD